MMPELCNKCQSIEVHYRSDYRGDQKPVTIKQYASLAEVKTGSGLSCSFCSLILRSVRSDYATRIPVYAKGGVDSEDLTKILCKYNQGLSNIEIQYSFRKGLQTTHCRLGGLYAYADSPAATHISGRPVSEDPSSEDDFQLIEDWMQECEANHPQCNHKETALPTRLIDVVSSKGPHLFIPEDGVRGRYLTLSYCWGKSDDQHVLTRATLEQKKKSISLSTLPKTIKDAMITTRRLGYSYLWIDALCILQDDQADWLVENQNMGAIYSNSSVTLCASRARSVADGFLGHRTLPQDAPLPFHGPHSTEAKVYIREEDSSTHEEDEPLNDRAWALQERYLSPRTLLFGSNQTIWECRTTHFSESQALRSTPRNNQLCEDFESPKELHQRWPEIIEEYTRRSLTNPSDRLPALQGLASHISTQVLNDEYLFGHWKSQLPRTLLWHTVGEYTFTRRPSGCDAPSWSWASVKGEVRCEAWNSQLNTACCKVLPASPVTGRLQLKGILSQAFIMPSKGKNLSVTSYPFEGRLFIPTEGAAPVMKKGTIRFDDTETGRDVVREGEVWCLVITEMSGLLLEETEETNVWRRVGMYKFSKGAAEGEGGGWQKTDERKDNIICLI